MGWVELPAGTPNERAVWRTAKKTRFLVDENLGPEVTALLRSWGLSVTDVFEEGLVARSDDDVFSFAWREKRVLLTHDDDFLDNARFPENRNAGLVVLPGASGEDRHLLRGLLMVRTYIEKMPDTWRGMKATIHGEEMIARYRDFDTGARKTMRFKLPLRGSPSIWQDGE